MDFLKLIKIEIKKIFSSNFLLITAAILIIGSIVFPFIVNASLNKRQDRMYYGGYDQGDLVIDGQVIETTNPCYWDLRDTHDYKQNVEGYASTKADDLTLEYLDMLLEKYLQIAQNVTGQEDYRRELIWEMSTQLGEKFILEHLNETAEDLQQAVQFRFYKDVTELQKYFDMTEAEVMDKIDAVNEKIALIDDIIIGNDYLAFYDYKISNQQDQIESLNDQITALEQDIIESPQNEEMYNNQIESMRTQIDNINNISLPTLQYKKDNNIIPNSGDWREEAVNNIENMKYNLFNYKIIPQDEFENNEQLKNQYETYQNYSEKMQDKIDQCNNAILVAQSSLDSGKPDMTFVTQGARSQTVNFLWYSMAIAVFGVLIGGGLIAKEFQDGTIRLLLIRPKTRTKLLLSKLFALLAVCALLYFGAGLVNMLFNGIVFGFSDFSYPNYTISSGAGGVGFISYFLPKFLVCFVTILFAVSTAFFFSVVTKNTAVSVAVPIICFVASLIGMQVLAYTVDYHWVAYTPLPYINLSSFFTNKSNNIAYSIYSADRGVQPILGYGVGLLSGLSVLLVGFAAYIFKKRDIAN